MNILIVGGAGFLGTNIAIKAKEKGHNVIIFDSFVREGVEDNAKVLGIKVIRGDIRNKEDFDLIPYMSDAVIHLAGQVGVGLSISNPIYDFNTNVIGTLNVLEYARDMGDIPVIFASSNKVFSDKVNSIPVAELETRYDWDDKKGISEDFLTLENFGRTPYGVSKLTGALYCQEYFHTYELPTVVNHMSCLYGYYQQGHMDQGWVDNIAKQIIKGEKVTIFGNGKQVRDMLWCEDVAELYLLQLENIEKIKGESFCIGGGYQNTMSLIEAISHISNIAGNKADVEFRDWRLHDQKVFYNDLTKVNKMLDWTPKVSAKEGIERMVKMYAR